MIGRSKPKVRTSPRWNRLISLKAFGILVATTLLMFVIGYFVAVRILFPPLPEPESGIIVPDVTGQTVAGAQETLRALGLRVTDVLEIEHPTIAAGVITAQTPLPGQQLREMGTVHLGVSAGPLPLPTPPVPEVEAIAEPRFAPLPEFEPERDSYRDSVRWTIPPPADSAAAPDSVSFSR